MTSPGTGRPAGSARASRGSNTPPVQRPVVSPLLRSGPGVDEAARARLVYTIDGRQAVLVELKLAVGVSAEDMRTQFRNVFHAAFEHQSDPPPDALPISGHYMRCLLTQDEIAALAEQ